MTKLSLLLPLVLRGEAEDEVEEDAVEDGPPEEVEHHPPLAVLLHADAQLLEDVVARQDQPDGGLRGEDMVPVELVHQQALVRVLHRRDGVHPLPRHRDAVAVQEVAAEEEEERRERDHRGVPASSVAFIQRSETPRAVSYRLGRCLGQAWALFLNVIAGRPIYIIL